MKIRIVLLSLVAWSFVSQAQTWKQVASLGSTGRYYGVGVTVGALGYMGLGKSSDGSFLSDFNVYNPATNNWLKLSNFPAGGRYEASAFSVKGKIYLCFGLGESTSLKKDLWEYNPANDSWKQKSECPGLGRYAAKGFVIGDSVFYVGTGSPDGGTYFSDIWQYNPRTDKWTQKANFPGGSRSTGGAFELSGNGYLGGGLKNSSSAAKDFYKYDPKSDTWAKMADLPISSFFAFTAFVIHGKGYFALGAKSVPAVNLKIVYQYNPVSNKWDSILAPESIVARRATCGFVIGRVAYMGTGYIDGTLTNDIWSMDLNAWYATQPELKKEKALSIFPNPCSGLLSIQFSSTVAVLDLGVYDGLGRLVYHMTMPGEKEIIDVHSYPSGIYYLKIRTSKEVQVNKFEVK